MRKPNPVDFPTLGPGDQCVAMMAHTARLEVDPLLFLTFCPDMSKSGQASKSVSPFMACCHVVDVKQSVMDSRSR